MRRPATILISASALALGILMLGSSARADAYLPLKVKMAQPAARQRSGGPVAVEVTLDWSGKGLLQGRLVVVFERALGVDQCESADLALVAGEQTFQMLLPAVSLPVRDLQSDVELRFKTASGTVSLGKHPLFVADAMARYLDLCVSDPYDKRDLATNNLAKSLRLDRFGRARESDMAIVTTPVHRDPEDLPAYPLGWCCYDVVLLKGDGFALLRERQLKSLLRWVEAGGSVCVVPDSGMKAYHVQFLNALAGGKTPAFELTAIGRVKPLGAASPKGPWQYSTGVGRSVVMTSFDAEEDGDSPAWKRSVCFLWNVRRDVANRVAQGETLGIERTYDDGSTRAQGPMHMVYLLLPETTRLVPLGLIVLLLALFVVAVGPGEYFLLGLLRMRKLTWIVFPLLATALTVFTVHLTNRYMGSSDSGRSMTFVDVGEGGRALRVNRYELVFSPSTRRSVTEVKDGFYAPVSMRDLDSYPYYGRSGMRGGGPGGPESDAPPAYSGRLPTHYTVAQDVRKWTPQLNRTLSLDAAPADPRIHWDALDHDFLRSADTGAPSWIQSCREKLVGAGAFDGDIYVMWPYKTILVSHGPGRSILQLRGDSPEAVYLGSSVLPSSPVYRADAQPSEGPANFLSNCFIGKGPGPTSVFSKFAPTVGGGFDDLLLMDETEGDSRMLVVVVVRSGDGFVVYRRLYNCASQQEGG